MLKLTLSKTTLLLTLFAVPSLASAQWSESGVDVGPGHAGASAGADGAWTFVDTDSRVDGGNSFGRGVGIGVGPDGISISHSVGFNGGGVGAGHNFNMTIGREGTHVSGGHVMSHGGDSRIITGGGSGSMPGGFGGGSYATGFGTFTDAHTHADTRRFPRPFGF